MKKYAYGFIAGVMVSCAGYGFYIFTQPENENIPDKKDVIEIIDNREKELNDYADKTKKLSDRIDLYFDNAVDYKQL
jgi:hypothetical protein